MFITFGKKGPAATITAPPPTVRMRRRSLFSFFFLDGECSEQSGAAGASRSKQSELDTTLSSLSGHHRTKAAIATGRKSQHSPVSGHHIATAATATGCSNKSQHSPVSPHSNSGHSNRLQQQVTTLLSHHIATEKRQQNERLPNAKCAVSF
jgi:hypothetical protein